MLSALLRTQHGKDHCAGKLGVVSDTVNGPRLDPVNPKDAFFSETSGFLEAKRFNYHQKSIRLY